MYNQICRQINTQFKLRQLHKNLPLQHDPGQAQCCHYHGIRWRNMVHGYEAEWKRPITHTRARARTEHTNKDAGLTQLVRHIGFISLRWMNEWMNNWVDVRAQLNCPVRICALPSPADRWTRKRRRRANGSALPIYSKDGSGSIRPARTRPKGSDVYREKTHDDGV